MKIKKILFIGIFLFSGVFCFAQEIKYISYFPVPYVSHSKVNVKTLAILGSAQNAAINVGSNSNKSGGLSIVNSFAAYNNVVLLSKSNSLPASGVSLIIGSYDTAPSSPSANGYLYSYGDVTVSQNIDDLTSVTAGNLAVIGGLRWGIYGGIGLDGNDNTSWGGCSGNLYWAQLKIDGTDDYETYLTCGG